MFTFVAVPSATTTLAAASEWASPFFDDLKGIAFSGIGFVIGGLLLAFLLGAIVNGVSMLALWVSVRRHPDKYMDSFKTEQFWKDRKKHKTLTDYLKDRK